MRRRKSRDEDEDVVEEGWASTVSPREKRVCSLQVFTITSSCRFLCVAYGSLMNKGRLGSMMNNSIVASSLVHRPVCSSFRGVFPRRSVWYSHKPSQMHLSYAYYGPNPCGMYF